MRELFITLTVLLFITGCGSSNSNSSSDITITSTHKSTNFAALSQTDNTYIEHIETVGLNGTALDVALSEDGNYLYVASGDFGLQVLDISDKDYPKLIGTYDSYGYVNHVEVIENIVYLSYITQSWDNYERVNAYDITDPSDAKYLGYHEGYTSSNHKSIDTVDEIYYLQGNNFVVVNKNRDDYQTYTLYDPYALVVCNGYAYIANGREGISIFKVLQVSHASLINP